MKAETTAFQAKTQLVREANRVPRWVMPLVKTLIFAADAILTALCFMAAFAWREGEPIFAATDERLWSREFAPYAAVLVFAVPVRLAMLLYQRVYRTSGAFSYTREAIKIFKAVSVGSLLIIAITFLFRGGFAYRDFSYSRGVFLLDFAFALVAFTVFHLALRRAQAFVRERDINLIPTLIIGSGAEAEQTIKELQSRPDLGYRVVGVITKDEGGRMKDEKSKFDSSFILPPSSMLNGVPIIGDLTDLASVVRELAIQEVIITDDTISHADLFEAMMKIGRRQRVEFRLAPSVFNLLPQKTEVEQIGILPMVRLSANSCRTLNDLSNARRTL